MKRRIIRRCFGSDACLYWLNAVLLSVLIAWWFYTFVLTKQLTNEIEQHRLSINPKNDHGFDTDTDYALEVFDFMDKHRSGKIRPKNMIPGPEPMHTHRCWFGQPTFPTSGIVRPTPDWQLLEDIDNGLEMYLYSAYYDTRQNDLYPTAAAVIQVLTMVRRVLTIPVYCQLWSVVNASAPSLKVTAFAREIWQRPWDPRNRFYVPVLLSCPIPPSSSDLVPQFVSITTNPCEQAANSVPIAGSSQSQSAKDPESQRTSQLKEDKVVVCVKGMDFLDDVSSRLVEWIEAQLLMGADKIVMYTYALHPTTGTVLDYYAKLGKLQHIPITLAGHVPNIPSVRSNYIWRNRQQKRRNELIPYNDCLFRHIHTHDYVLIVDTDELVVPLGQHRSWTDLLQHVRGDLTDVSSFSIVNAFKFDNLTTTYNDSIPEYMHMLRHDMRSRQLSAPGAYGKSFVYVPNVLTVFNHFPLHRMRRNVRNTKFVDRNAALKLHYKEKCPIESRDECPNLMTDTVRDNSLDRFASELMQRTRTVVESLRLV